MKNLHTTAKLKLSKTVVTRYTKPQRGTSPLSTSDLTVSVSTILGVF
jgi:hypothetical protein